MSRLKPALPPEQDRTQQFIDAYVNNRWMNLGDVTSIQTINPFLPKTEYDIENPHIFMLELMLRPENFFFTCKHVFNRVLPPFQLAIIHELWTRPFPMLLGSRGMGKSFILALYAMLRAFLNQGSKIVIVGAAFRQAKVVFDYCQEIWESAPILRDIVGSDKRNGPRRDVDRCTLRMGDSLIVALPLGDGTKIRGQRANIIIADEFASIPVDVFETVVRGFGAVSMSPIEKLQKEARKLAIKELGMWTEEHEAIEGKSLTSNQTVISGTAYYTFNHFYDYWKQYKAIIESKGDRNRLEEIFQGEIPDNFRYQDYCIIRIPVHMLPPGFMDDKSIGHAKATMHFGGFQMEYGACFPSDSNGFYKRSLVESCVVGKPGKPIEHRSCGEADFTATMKGNPKRSYVMGVDPASERDNFSIVIVECWEDHRRIVHCWTTTRDRYKQKVKRGLAQEHDFYHYAARKIRSLLKLFPCERIALDSQGGGVAVMEALADKTRLQPGDKLILPVIDPEKPQDSDHLAGEHILELVNFADGKWVAEANHGMRKDFEDKTLLFPRVDAVEMGLALEEDKALGRVVVDSNDMAVEKLYDTLDDCVLEIEDLKDELATIIHSQTGTSKRDRWDTPETKQSGGKKGRLRKDRYSSLLMANMTARVIQRTPKRSEYEPGGGFARDLHENRRDGVMEGPMWTGPGAGLYNQRFKGSDSGKYGAVVRRQKH